ncbi:MAG: hypothetical protein IMW92_02305 [Bacillales bacterium]|nr:hypothetical protein [Bacillales bacterium]
MEQKAAEKADENHNKANDRKPHKRHTTSLLSKNNEGISNVILHEFPVGLGLKIICDKLLKNKKNVFKALILDPAGVIRKAFEKEMINI